MPPDNPVTPEWLHAVARSIEGGNLPPEMRAWLEAAPKWNRGTAIAERNKLIRSLADAMFPDLAPSTAAARIADLVTRHRPMPTGETVRDIDAYLDRIKETGARWPLGVRQIRSALAGN